MVSDNKKKKTIVNTEIKMIKRKATCYFLLSKLKVIIDVGRRSEKYITNWERCRERTNAKNQRKIPEQNGIQR